MSFMWSDPVRSFWRSAALTALLTLVAVVGCAGRGDVAGKVTYKGKPLVFGTVQFEASDRSLKQGILAEDGSYFIPGLPVGEAKVAVNSPNPTSSDFQPLQREDQPPPPRLPEIKGWFPIPAQYQDISKPQLSYTVKSGQNTIDIDLK